MKQMIALLALLAPLWASPMAAPPSTNSIPANRVLMIDPSSMPVAAGKATLTIGALQRADGMYTGGYRINVSPYFYKNEKGKLNIVVSDESLAKISRGQVAAITGTATTSGAGGKSRHIDATATPASNEHGKLKLWFMSGDRKMIFEPAYHFAEKHTPATRAQTNTTSKLNRPAPVSHRAVEASRLP